MRIKKKNHPFRLFIGAVGCLAAMLAAGCAAAGQEHVRPDIPVTESWHTPLADGLSSREPDPDQLVTWWKTLDDPVLTGLIEKAVTNNLELRSAKARIRQARAERSVAQASLFPALDAVGSVVRSGEGDDSAADSSRTMYAAGFDAGWEIDLFGGIRRSVEAAEAKFQASREDLHDVLVSLTAEVAVNYLELRTSQARLRVAQQNLKLQEDTYRLEQYRLIAGLSDELAAAQARSNMENTRSGIPALCAQVEASKNRLAVLLGEQPGSQHETLDAYVPLPAIPLEVAVGVPADLLRRRPDIRMAERELAAQTARVGAAVSDLYPRFYLNGAIGYESLSSGNLLTADSLVWSWGPKVTWPVFHGNAIRANIEVQSALQEQAAIHYESAVLSALEEVEDALSAYVEEQIRRSSLTEAAAAAKDAADFAQNNYDAGMIDFDTVLDAQRTLLSYQDALVQSEAAVVINLVRLYKALGGGWTPMGAATGT